MTSSSIENTERLEALSVCGGVDYSEKSDLDLVNLMCDGDGDAFVEIVSRYETKLIAYSRRYVGSLDLAKDICQEVFLKLIESYETGLFNRILYEREYNLRAMNGEDIGIRVHTNRISDPTARKAIENLMIREAIEEANDSGNILKDTDDPEKHKRDILTLRMMRREYEVFNTSLNALTGREYRITYRYIQKEQKLEEIADDENLAYQSIKNLIAATRKTLEQRIIPFFRESL